jgi:glycosyltransferase involved in cell wall biosynthesis
LTAKQPNRMLPPSRPLRVCHLAYTFYENDNRVIRYAESLAEQGASVDVIALRRAGQARSGTSRGVRVFRIQRRAVNEKAPFVYLLKIVLFLFQASVVLSLLQLWRRYDVVHVHNVPDFLVFGAIVPKLMGTRIVLDIHDILPELYAGKFGSGSDSAIFRRLLFVESICCRFADHVIVANHLWHAKLTRRAVPAGKCITILNYPDLRLFKPVSQDRKRKDGKFIVLYPGTLNHHQGLDIAVKALALIKDRVPAAELHVYGEGPDGAALMQLAHELRIDDRVKVMQRLPIDAITEVMALADVGVVPKRADGFGNEAFSTKILEFMACRVPVIVSRTKIDAYYFDDSLVRFFKAGDEHDLAVALADVYERRHHLCEWVDRAHDFAVRNSWQERVGDYRFLIEALVGKPRECTSIV